MRNEESRPQIGCLTSVLMLPLLLIAKVFLLPDPQPMPPSKGNDNDPIDFGDE